ncbi:Calx-beta domain-containing protein [Vibrio harveyi]|uniref:Calx-beta domain-containing protein n=2 Tax=Vibrio harveyi TaxID=669 RepID=UPI00390A6FAF
MDRAAFGSLASNIVVIGIDGEIKTLKPDQLPAPGELIITEVSDTSQLNFEQVAPDGSSINVSDDITALIEAIAAGADPAQVEGDFEPAAGESDGSSPQSTGAIDRTGAESLASTDFETVGTLIPLSQSQELSLLEFVNQEAIILAQVIIQDISSPTISEGDPAIFDITLDQPTQQETEVTLSLSDDSATGGADYDNSVITITFEDGSTDQINVGEDGTFSVSIPIGDESFVITVDTIDDDVFEGNETFTLSGGTENQPEPVTGVATITDDGTGPGEEPDDDRPTVASVSDTTVNEGEEAVLEVTLSNPSTSETTVNMTLSDGTAEGGLDYTNTSVTITFEDNSTQIVNVNPDGSFAVTVPANEVSYNVTINTINDDLFEGTETFTLSGSTENQNGTTSGTGTIVDDGSGPGPNPDDDRPTVASISDTTVNEGDLVILDVTLSNLSTTDTVVSMNLADGSAEGGIDYTNTSVTITFEDNSTQVVNINPDGSFDVSVPANNISYSVTISTIDDDLFEGSETFTLSGNTGNQAIPQTGTGTIVDDGTGPGPDPDDDRPTVSISDAGVVNEGDTANFVVSLTNEADSPVQVELGLDLGDTETGDLGVLEYNTGSGWVAVPNDGVVTVPAGLSEFDVRVATIDDEVFEGPEEFSVSVTGLDSVQGSDSGSATIVDDNTGPSPDPDDDRPTVSISDAGTINEGDTANFVVSLTNASEAPVEVQLDLNLGDMETGDLGTFEYNTGSGWVAVPVDGVVTVPAGLTEFNVRIASIDDEVYEGPENFTVDVTGLGPVQGTDTGSATIVDDGTGPDPDPDDDRPTVSITDAGTINEGDTANFVVSLTNASEAPVEVQLDLNLGDTEAGDLGTLEYNTGSGWVAVPVDGIVSIPAGMTQFDVRITSIDDEVYEGPENFTVDVTGLGPVLGTDTGTATIVDDGTGPEPEPDDDRPTVSISDAGTINEGNTANFVVSLTNASEAPVEVQLDLNLGDTEAGDLGTLEYNTGSGWATVPVDGVVTVPTGLTEFDVRIASIDDEVYEGPENFTVDVTGLGPVQGTDTGTATIVDDGTGPEPEPDDDRPTVSISDAGTINEGDTANFVVSLTNASEAPAEVQLDLNLGDTEVGDLSTLEYNTGSGWVAVPVSGVVTVPAGLTEFDVRIASIDDEVYEGPENFTVDVTGLGPVQGTDTGTATIVDDGTGPEPEPDDDRPTVSISDAGTINEGDTANFVVSLTNASEAPVEVQLDLNLGDTEAGDLGTLEYNTGSGWVAVPVSGVVSVPAGMTQFDVRIASIDDEVYEGPENFTVDVTGLGPVQGTDTGAATIVDDGTGPDPDPDDDRPTVSISDAGTINEGDTANFVVSLTNASEAPVEVQLDLNLGDTEAGDLGTLEYNTGSGWVAVPIDGVVTVPAGLTEFDVRIASIDDEVYEGPENFTVDVTGLGPVQGSDTGTATIVDDGTGPDPDPDDDRPTVSITDAGTINEGDTANFVVSLTNASEAPVEVQLDLNLGDTEAGDLGGLEYNTGSGWVAVPVDGVVTVPAGLTEFDVRIASIDDEVYEGPENFTVDVTGLGPVQGTDTGTATIVDDGTGPVPDPDDDRPTVSISDAGTINEGDTANFVVSLTNASEAPVEVQLDLNLGDTEAGDLGTLEYNTGSGWVAVPIDGVVTVPAGLTEFDVRIASIDDEVYEGPENFTVDVTGLGPVQGSDTGTATIVDDGTGPDPDPDDDRPTVSITDAGTINEGDTANFVVSLTNASEAPVEVQLDLNLGDTEAGDLGGLEYNTGSGWVAVPVDGVVTVPAGLTEFDVRIASIDDEVYEGPENFTVDVTGLGPVQGADTGTATIVDDGTGPEPDPDDDRPTVSISDAGTINEGDTANFVVSLTNASEAPVEVQLDLNLGDTEAGDLGTLEYNTGSGWVAVPVNGVVSVPAGLTEFDVRIASIDDEVYEGPENFTVDVTGLGPVQGSDTGTATIVDDGTGPEPDPDDDRPTVSISDAGTINEGDTANFVVSLTNASESPVEVQLDLNLGDTEVGDLGTLEYNTGSGWVAVPVGGVVSVPAGLTEFDVRIASIDDEVYEGPENFTVDVTGLGPVQGSDTGTATIVDDGTGPDPDPDDDRPTVSISDAGTINEGDTANFVVSLTNASEAPVEVQLDLNLGDTEVGDLGTLEYNTGSGWVAVPVDGVVTVPAGLTEFDVRIASIDDEVYEGPEYFTVDVTGLGPVQGSDTGTATIVDDGTGPEPDPDDDRPTVSISDAGTINEGDTANFVVSLSNASEAPVEVQLDLNLGDTEVGDLGTLEYNIGSGWVAVPIDGVVTVPAGLTEFDVRIASIDDEVYEGPENFTVDVIGLGPVQGTDTGTATIVDDGTGPGPDPDDDRPTVTSITNTMVNEGELATLDVTLSNLSTTDTIVNMSLDDGSATGGVDYNDTTVTITYEDNSTEVVAVNLDGSFSVNVPVLDSSFSITMNTINDDIYEGNEVFTLSGATSAQSQPAVGTVTIHDEADKPVVSDITNVEVFEGNDATFNVTLSNASTVAVLVSMSLLDGTALAGDDFNASSVTITYADNTTEVVNVNLDGTFDVSVPANDTTFSVTVNTVEDQIYEQTESFTLTGEIQGQNSAASGLGTILDDDNTPPTVEDFNIIIDLNDPGEDALIDFGPYAQDFEDDLDPLDDKETSICITTLPEYGYLYYFDDQNNEVVLEIGDVIPESTEVRYALTEDFFDEQSFDSQDLLDEFDKDFIADSVDVNGLSFFGGTIDNNGDFINNARIKVDFANQQVGLVVVSPGETGQGDEISTSEFIAIELDEGLEAEEARLDLASLNDQFNNGAAWINVYFYSEGVLTETQVIETSDIVFTGNQEGFANIAISSGSFDEIRLFPETNSSSDKASFTLVGTQITSFNNVNDSFDYKAIDSDGLTSADTATVDIDFSNVSVDAVEALGMQVAALQVNTIEGTVQDDTLIGTDGNDVLIGGLGDDELTGNGGNDVFKWTEMDTATDTVTDFESGDSLDFTDLFDDVSENDISVLLDDLSSGDYAGEVDDISVTVTEDGGNSTLTINKDGQQLDINFDGASAADIANSIITNLEQLRE